MEEVDDEVSTDDEVEVEGACRIKGSCAAWVTLCNETV